MSTHTHTHFSGTAHKDKKHCLSKIEDTQSFRCFHNYTGNAFLLVYLLEIRPGLHIAHTHTESIR